MNLYITATADNHCLAVHQTSEEAREFAANWRDHSGQNRFAARLFEHDRESGNAFKRASSKIILKNVREISL